MTVDAEMLPEEPEDVGNVLPAFILFIEMSILLHPL